jgi:hypothetical protein
MFRNERRKHAVSESYRKVILVNFTCLAIVLLSAPPTLRMAQVDTSLRRVKRRRDPLRANQEGVPGFLKTRKFTAIRLTASVDGIERRHFSGSRVSRSVNGTDFTRPSVGG